MSIDVQPSSPESPGTLLCNTDYAPDGAPTAVIVTRADRWIQVNREFAARLRDEGQLGEAPARGLIDVGRPNTVRYRYVRQFDQHSDLYARVTVLPGEWPLPLEPEDSTRAVFDKMARQATAAEERAEQLQKTLDEVLGHFTQQGHPGEPCLRTSWLPVGMVNRWRRVAAGRPSWDELFALIDVELTPWQRDVLRDAWEYREVRGQWPALLGSQRRHRPGHKTLHAAAAELLERARAAGWAE